VKYPDYRAVVAVILALGVVIVLVRYVWMADVSNSSIEAVRMWKELLLVIIGVLAGYISYHGGNDKDE
jgi:hypothetical protein